MKQWNIKKINQLNNYTIKQLTLSLLKPPARPSPHQLRNCSFLHVLLSAKNEVLITWFTTRCENSEDIACQTLGYIIIL